MGIAEKFESKSAHEIFELLTEIYNDKLQNEHIENKLKEYEK